jgi:hypothetical protein
LCQDVLANIFSTSSFFAECEEMEADLTQMEAKLEQHLQRPPAQQGNPTRTSKSKKKASVRVAPLSRKGNI